MRLIGPPAPPPRHPTLAHALAAAAVSPGRSLRSAAEWPGRAPPSVAESPGGVTFVDLREREVRSSWGEVAARAARAGAALSARGVRPGDRVALVLRTEPAFLDAFFGAWACGAVPVPLYPPVRLGRLDEWVAATARMLRVSGARLVVSSGGTRALLAEVVAMAADRRERPGEMAADRRARLGEMAADRRERPGDAAAPPPGLVDAAALLEAPPAPPRLPEPGDLGLVQFSSGSTVDPKPVALTHAALQAQADALMALVRPTADDVLCSWLPLYHDMGLIGGLLGAMSYPGPLVLIPPEHFLARPALWLRAMARHRATISMAPSFAYAYCAERVTDADLDGASLAPWRLALDGAEPVSGEALRAFAARFAPHGLDPAALVPVYGLSEAALAVTFAAPGGPLAGLRLDAAALAAGRVEAAPGAGPGVREVLSLGGPIPGVEVEVRREDGAPAGEGRVGRIWVRGPSLLAGYLGDPAATAAALVGGWLDTGDLGFALGGALHVHGRAKDLVIVRGANHAPDEFEAALAGLPGLRPGCAVALGFTPAEGGEALLLLAERARGAAEVGDEALEAEVRRAVSERTGVAPHTVAILAPGTLPRTSSGKLRRQEALRRFLEGTLAPPRAVSAFTLALEVVRSRWRAAVAPRGRGG